MKKLFTTILMMGVALCGWATITETSSGTTVTLNYVDDGNSNDQNFNLSNRNATTIVLTGDWANKDLQKIGNIVNQCSGYVFLDMSACTKMVSKVDTGNGNIDWTSDNLSFLPDPNNPETVQRTGSATPSLKFTMYGNPYSGPYFLNPNDNKYYPNENYNSWEVLTVVGEIYLDENGKELPEDATITPNPDNTYSYSYTETLDATKFSLAGNDFSNHVDKLSGIAFPNHANFTAIPDNVFGGDGIGSLHITSATLSEYTTWVGKNAFRSNGTDANLNRLQSVNFPASLKVIDGEAFHGSNISSAPLAGCTGLVKIGYEAFEECANLTTVTFPEGNTFTFLGNDAFHKSGITSIDMHLCTGITEFKSKGDNGVTFKTFAACNALTSVILPPNIRAIPDGNETSVFSKSFAIEYLEFTGTPVYSGCELQNGLYIGKEAFSFCRNLQTILFSKNVETISANAFQDAAITEIHIPASVKEIEIFAFDNCQQLRTVYFDEFDKTYGNCDGAETHIAGAEGSGGQGHGAFEECQNITDVYINTMAELQCDNNGFDQDITWGAGDPGKNFATLHFPKETIEHYVNLQHYLTDEIVANHGLFHDWLMEHYRQAIVPHKNGWYEFINSGPTDPDGPEYQEIILRTFSDWDYSYLVPDGIRAYVVSAIAALTSDTYEVTLQRIRVIPAKTGVILYGHPNGKNADGSLALVMHPVAYAPGEGLPLCRANWADNYVKNYLEPILSANGTDVNIKPYEKYQNDPTKPVMYRNFALGRYTATDYQKDAPMNANVTNYVGFFRMKDRAYKSGYAYLRLAGDVDENGNELTDNAIEFPLQSGGEILVKEDVYDADYPDDPEHPAYFCEYSMKNGAIFDARAEYAKEGHGNNPKGWWVEADGFTWKEFKMSWGDRTSALNTLGGSTSALKYFGELEEDADGIVKIVIPANSTQGDYYTIQGVKVTNPTKGVYIQNGKKVIVK